jgi:hypothetical protein
LSRSGKIEDGWELRRECEKGRRNDWRRKGFEWKQ